MAMYYHRRKCSQNVYFLERSRQRGSEPILKEIPSSVDNIHKWNTSIQKVTTLSDDKNTTSLSTLRIPPSIGYDWRNDRERENSSCENSPRGIRVLQRTNLRLTSIDDVKPTSPKTLNIVPTASPKQPKQTLEEENRRLRELLNQSSSENKLLKGENERLQKHEKEIEEQIRHRNKRLDELERDKWLVNHKLAELLKQNLLLEEKYRNSIDPNEFEDLRRKVQMLQQIQQQMQRQLFDDGVQWQKDRYKLQQETNMFRQG